MRTLRLSSFIAGMGIATALLCVVGTHLHLAYHTILDCAAAPFVLTYKKVFAPEAIVSSTPATVFGFAGFWLGYTPDTQV